MSDVVEAYAALVGVPALVGLALPRRVRRAAGLAAAGTAVLLRQRGLNVHGYSALFFFLCTGIALGALLREAGGALWRAGTGFRRASHG